MPRHRYQRRDQDASLDTTLPLDTTCTVITRQSTLVQGEKNIFSLEKNPDELVEHARRLGFGDVQVLDWDMGIGAYKTTIEDRRALQHWLYELLPKGLSKVLLVSQEDRLFRDETEIEHNRFIEQVRKYGGWVVCGPQVYDFRREFDRERFRQVCRFAKQYVEHQIIRRLHPAAQRAAMQGRYVGGYVPWGYVVDYRDPHAPTYKHLMRYEPHAALINEQIFRRFASMLRPGVVDLARGWWRDGLVWPFLSPEVDQRTVRMFNAHCHHDPDGRGYRFNRQQARNILTNVVYVGWVFRKGELATLPTGEPRICHEPLVDPDLFWWCYDRLVPNRPEWAPVPLVSTPVAPRARRSPGWAEGEVMFLAPGLVRCAAHERSMALNRGVTRTSAPINLRCRLDEVAKFAGERNCVSVRVPLIEDALRQAFVDQLMLDEEDMRNLAQLAERRDQGGAQAVALLERELAEHRATFEAAKRMTLTAPDLAAEYVVEMRTSKRAIQEVEARLQDVQSIGEPSLRAWATAQRAFGWADRIRSTFHDWSRDAQALVLGLALQEAVVGRVGRNALGIWTRWFGGAESRRLLLSRGDRRLAWTEAEEAALCAHFHHLSREGLCAMLPGRSFETIWQHAYKLGLRRVGDSSYLTLPPVVVQTPTVPNDMERYGFVDLENGAMTEVLSAVGSEVSTEHQ